MKLASKLCIDEKKTEAEKQALEQVKLASKLSIVKDHVARPSPSISGMSLRVSKYQRPCPALLFSTRPCVYTSGRRSPLSLCLLPLAAQRNGEKRMYSSVYLLMLSVCEKLALLTGIHHVGPCPSNSIASCGAVSCLINTLADGAEGLHFSAI